MSQQLSEPVHSNTVLFVQSFKCIYFFTKPASIVIQMVSYGFCDWSEFIDPGVPHYLFSPASV